MVEPESRRLRELWDETPGMRLGTAAERDLAAELRDLAADDRDAAAAARELDSGPHGAPRTTLLRAAADRRWAAEDRLRAADDRARAAADRHLAALDRVELLRMHDEASSPSHDAATDRLTGARLRSLGLEEITRELVRASRTGTQLMLAFVDVDELDEVNDRRGYLAGDDLLRLVGETLHTHLRPYDVIVRYGGDEFLCAMPHITAPESRARFQRIAHALAAVDAGHALSFGLVQAHPDEPLEALIARADSELLKARDSRE